MMPAYHKGLVWMGLWVVMVVIASASDAAPEAPEAPEAASHRIASEEDTEETEPHYAILFPWFVEILGVCVFFISTRYFKLFPYTAIMFLLGTFMGIGIHTLDQGDQLTESIRIWESINSEVLLLVFLPGLIFHDAYSLNVHVFQVSFVQCLLMAFPMVLAGTTLIACVAYYIFPYGWSFNLAMTFGSILSATDPVAVNALLNEVGAPQRLKMHITGESLLNDGSAIVFFTIFAGLFLSELGEGVGDEVNVAEGFSLFFRMSLGGACIGIAFGIVLTAILYNFSRRLDPEENVMQVASTITLAYLCYYVADSVAHTSGVISVVFCGIFTKAFGASFINDKALMENFWVLTEHLLNTLLFALGGTVWGTIISNTDPREFGAKDWGYLILLYVLITIIRFLLVFMFYPVVSRIGLKSSWKEAIFLSYGGLRGAVGISLAIALDDEVFRNTEDPTFRLYSTKLFGMTGGIAFLTLFINGSTAGWVLSKLGLTQSSKIREKLTETYYRHFKENLLNSFVHLLADPYFADVDFELVRDQVPYLKDLTPSTLKEIVLKNKENTPASIYHRPHLDNVLKYLMKSTNTPDFDTGWVKDLAEFETTMCEKLHASYRVLRSIETVDLEELQSQQGTNPETIQLRLIFLELVRAAYLKQIEKGWLTVHDGSPGFVSFALKQGVEFAIDAVNQGEPLQDWEKSFLVRQPWEDHKTVAVSHVKKPFLSKKLNRVLPRLDTSVLELRISMNRAIAFLEAHKKARKFFEEEFCSDELTNSEKIVIKESFRESKAAEDTIASLDKDQVQGVVAHIMSSILLNKASRMIEKVSSNGLLQEKEASEKMEELEEHIEHLKIFAGDHKRQHKSE